MKLIAVQPFQETLGQGVCAPATRKQFWRVWFDFTTNSIEPNNLVIRWMAAVYPKKHLTK